MMQHHTTATAPPTLPFPPLSSFALPSLSSPPLPSTSTSSPTSFDTTVTSSITRPTTFSSMSQVSSPSYHTHNHGHHLDMDLVGNTASQQAPSSSTDPRYAPYGAADIYGMGDHHQGYIRILPRTSASSALYKKRCETCTTTHDGSFGAGRFCSSRCARTVGGLAHRKKRMMERDAKQRSAAEHRAKIKKRRHSFDRDCSLSEDGLFQFKRDAREVASCAVPSNHSHSHSPRSVITINSLLNPTEF